MARAGGRAIAPWPVDQNHAAIIGNPDGQKIDVKLRALAPWLKMALNRNGSVW